MNKTVLQVPLGATLRKKAEEGALQEGFSSLQEAVRVFLKKLAEKRVGITLQESEKMTQLSPKAIKRYNKMIDDIEAGKVKTKTFSSAESLMKHLEK